MKWKFDRISWHSSGDCWTWRKVIKMTFYAGNEIQLLWGRIAVVFVRREWVRA